MTDDLHNIVRIDIPRREDPPRSPTHGWQVKIRRQGFKYTKFFNDKKYDGKKGALEAAIRHRDEKIEELPEPEDFQEASREARSKSGVPGLSLSLKDDGSGTRKPYVQLSWTSKWGHRHTQSYSIDRWGVRKALWKACARLAEAHEEPEKVMEYYQTVYPNVHRKYPEVIDGTKP